MLACETTIEIDRPGRYLAQLCRHAAAMGATGGGHRPRAHATAAALTRGDVQVHAEYSDTHGLITLAPWGRCTLTAGTDVLTLRIEATDPDALRRIQEILGRDLERFGRRDGVSVTWPPPETTDDAAPMVPAGTPAARRHRRRNTILLGALIAVAVAVHLGLGALIVTDSRWPSITVDALVVIVLGIVLGKTALVWLAHRHGLTHRRPHRREASHR
ncbi:MAG: DUF2218 domain-containing protein [Mycobacteriales bacterium]